MHDLVEKIAESNFETSAQLRELISRPGLHDVASIDSSVATAEQSTDNTASSSASGSGCATSFDHSDGASIRTNATSFSIRSLRSIIPSFTDELSRSRAYKRLRHRTPALADPDAASIFSKDSKATGGDRWSMLSDISLGALSISEISVFELPICLSDLYDSEPYKVAMKAQLDGQPQLINQRRRRLAARDLGRGFTMQFTRETILPCVP